MADKKISSEKVGFTIPPHTSNSHSKHIIIKLAQTDRYDVYQKELPADLPTGYTWINNFGLKARHPDPNVHGKSLDTSMDDPYLDLVDEYTIEMDDIEGQEPVYFDGVSVKNFQSGKIHTGNKRIHVTLALGDPPVGWPK
ncbi:MAG: hypothetical protein NTW32_11415 [Chloroflexi bacterium]|nr:hypothetical protein [Chloroflexota bacterium]